LTLLDRGVVCAPAHVRGGHEMREAWYEQGKLLNKRNSFTDFIAVADFLVAQKIRGERPVGHPGRQCRRSPDRRGG
jgi:oligopeptidase B